jgi:hypothetical protein
MCITSSNISDTPHPFPHSIVNLLRVNFHWTATISLYIISRLVLTLEVQFFLLEVGADFLNII